MNINREIIAQDILKFCKVNKKRFIRSKYKKGKIMCSITEKPYSASQLGSGFRHLNEKGIAKAVSANCWKILSYEMEKEKE